MQSTENMRIVVEDGMVSAAFARPADAFATLVMAPGAGSSFDHPFLVGFSEALNAAGLATLRFNFPYREAGRRLPDRAPRAIAAWRAAMDAAAARSAGQPVWAAGKSFGGRMASMAVAAGMPAAGLVFLGYPLHPPGKPEKLRDEHLYGIDRPMLFVQGTRDPFAAPDELTPVVGRIGTATLELIDAANHSFEVRGAKRPAVDVGAGLAPMVAEFVRASVA
ncbi:MULTISPECIES: alpha/beta family hydrolase [unclassified Cryobacterium]|uniref:alpha/beta hydrolase family protein n=1 Tax=unclassified Cryobacterium TaxID=2649013 RepID=UPI00106C760B|nr:MULTISPECIES: alpha/beta family hydrolase [unclassified Cryobacterium]TFC52266.1 dienelactone hydrolase [Cryobacterium sp. TMB3-1-2]TFC59349.1 dienelactone hydrolase [Cryobacterium sp. TMB1-7]TFC69762.1 dienelactone hydrolase [Cryobacterium sp. TMB3-15]TFC79083.1 dienelactone hydrolase [Cryobacterium sp. TMB3-10]TFC89364.1 dienelactone hydrolase [Cryobacterium sp. TMT4-31]